MNDDNKEQEATLEEMLRDIKEYPGETKVGTIVHKGDAESPAPMVISSITGRGKVQVWDTKTGEMSWVLYNPDTGGMLRGLLKLKYPDGSPRFTTNKPDIEPPRGILKCLLHPEGPNRERYNEVGLPICKKSNITAPYMVEKHMKNRHPSAWAIIEKERVDKEKAEDKEFQRGIINLAKGSVEPEKAPLYVSNKDKAKQE